MLINPISSNNNININFRNRDYYEYYDYKYIKRRKIKKVAFITAGIAVATVAGIKGGKIIKNSMLDTFEDKLTKLNLRKEGEILKDKSTNKEFTGTIKSKINDFGKNRIKTCEYENGKLKEECIKSLTGRELQGKFYGDDGKYVEIYIKYTWGGLFKKATLELYNGKQYMGFDIQNLKGSGFDLARRRLKDIKYPFFKK